MHGPPSLPGSEARVESSIPPHPCTLPLSRQGVHADHHYATGVSRGQVKVGGSSRTKGRQRRAAGPSRPSLAPAPVRARGAGGREGWRKFVQPSVFGMADCVQLYWESRGVDQDKKDMVWLRGSHMSRVFALYRRIIPHLCIGMGYGSPVEPMGPETPPSPQSPRETSVPWLDKHPAGQANIPRPRPTSR